MDLRTFIAIELDSSLQLSLQKVQNELKSIPADVSWVRPANIHMTLKFLGEISMKKVKAIIEIFPQIFQDLSPFDIALKGLGVFPTIEHPKVIWVDISKGAEEIKNLAMILENALCRLGFPKERRKFTGHVTIGRVKSLKNLDLLTQAMPNFMFQEPIQQAVSKIVFFKSTLSSQGSIYEPLSAVELK